MSAAKKAKTDRAVLHPVLADELEEDTPLAQVYVATIGDTKNISKVIVDLNGKLPVPELAHLKRVKGTSVLLFPCTFCESSAVLDYLGDKGFDVGLLNRVVGTVEVARIPPRTRKQYDRVHKLWPCNFHSNKHVEKLSTNTLFSSDELKRHEGFMRVCIDVARMGKSKASAAVVIDPSINSIVAVGFDQSNDNPVKHAVMVAIDNVARTQNGGAWNPFKGEAEATRLNLAGVPEELLVVLQQKHPDVTFGAVSYKGKDDLEVPSDGPYLCTNYYVYSTREPCIMCAMALVHSRAKRVFYGASVAGGGLGSACKVHTAKDLNHHYEAFRGLLEDECINLS